MFVFEKYLYILIVKEMFFNICGRFGVYFIFSFFIFIFFCWGYLGGGYIFFLDLCFDIVVFGVI